MKRIVFRLAIITMAAGLAACSNDADVASSNLSRAADNFEVPRRIVFYNGITDTYILEVQGFCSVDNNSTPSKMAVTCKLGPGDYRKHLLGRSDNVTYFAEQLKGRDVSTSFYRVVFKPSTILPDIDLR